MCLGLLRQNIKTVRRYRKKIFKLTVVKGKVSIHRLLTEL